MKKVFFSAVALVAFSFASMANEIEEKKVEIETNQEKLTVGCDHCYDYADSLDNGKDRSNQKWMANVDACKVANGCEPVFTDALNP